MMRLSEAGLAEGSYEIDRSTYDRDQACGVVHLGIGAFHRGHQADFFDRLMTLGETGWMIQGASLRRLIAAEQLNPQDGLFTLAVRDGGKVERRLVRSIKHVLVAPEDPAGLVHAMASPDIALVTLTITEKGYCLDPSSGDLLFADDAVKWDLAYPSEPKTAPGFIVASLAARRAAGIAPYSVLSCDNIPENGARTRRAVLQMAERQDPELAQWIADHVTFPSSMVDRIVPATTEADVEALRLDSGYSDQAMVKTEPFSQWVIEDRFCNRRPALDRVGVQYTQDVTPFEKAKLRLLNAAHSALAHLGPMAGHEFVHDAINGDGFEHLIDAIWDEAETTLEEIPGFSFSDYRTALKERFRNAALQHRTRQIAVDGSQKIPQRFLNTVRERRDAGLGSPALAFALAGWMRWQLGRDEQGQMFQVDDPLRVELAEIAAQYRNSVPAFIESMFAFESVFGKALRHDSVFVSDVSAALSQIRDHGVAAAVREWRACV